MAGLFGRSSFWTPSSIYLLFWIMFSLPHLAISACSRSPRAYSALKNLGILQLPCEQKVETLVQSNAKAGLMRRWLQKNFQSMMSSQKSNRKKGDVSLLGLTPKKLPFLHDTSLQKFQDFLHSQIPLTRSYIVLQYHWSTRCMWEIVGPQFPLWLCEGDYKSHSVSTS